MQQGKKGFSIFTQLLLSFLGAVIVISSALTAVFYVYNKRSLEKHTTENVLQQFKAIEYHLRLNLQENLMNDLRILSSNPSIDAFMISSELEKEINARAVERLFLESLKYIHSYRSISFVDVLGKETIKVNRTGRVRQYRDLSRSALFTSIRLGDPGNIQFEIPRRDAAGQVVFSIGIHKTDADIGKFGGSVILDYNLQEFLEYLNKIRIFDENPIWVFDPNGRVLKQPANERARFDPRPYFTDGIQAESRLVQPTDGMVVYRDFLIRPGKPLVRLAIGIPYALLLGDIQQVLRFSMAVFLISIVAISLIAYYLAGYLSKPITELAHAAARLAKGDLSTQVATKTTGEIRLLVDSFNLMAADLEKTTVSRDYVNSIIHSMADTLVVVNPDGAIKTVNAALIGLLGYEEELVGKHLKTVFSNDSDKAERLICVLEKEGWVSSFETAYLSRTGRRIPVLVSGATIQDKDGVARGFVLIGKDITERKKAEERLRLYADELRESNNEIQSFSYIISHDLRAPLVSIKGFSSELNHAWKDIEAIIGKYLPGMDGKDRLRLDQLVRQDIHEALTFIASSTDRMDSLIKSILTLSRVGRRELMLERIDLEALVRGIIDSLAHQIGEKKVRVTIGDLPAIITDRLAMEQVMGNLIDNALKYLDPARPGRLEIAAEPREGDMVIHIRDNGRGIAQEDIPKVFEIFKRVGTQDVTGEGMGLAYVKALVKRQGGRIWCESELGKGSTFSFTIPRMNEGAA